MNDDDAIEESLSLKAEEWEDAGFVLATSAGCTEPSILVYVTDDTQWGFSLCSGGEWGQSWSGGFGWGEWEYLDDLDPRITKELHEEFDDQISEWRRHGGDHDDEHSEDEREWEEELNRLREAQEQTWTA